MLVLCFRAGSCCLIDVVNIFFGSTPTLERGFADVATNDKHMGTLVIAGEYIDNLDEAGATALITEAIKRREAGGSMHLWLRNHNFDHVIRNSGLLAAIGEENIHYVNQTTADRPATQD